MVETKRDTKVKASLIEVRQSPIHGRGVFALRRIRKGQRIIEYLGERITPEDGENRYDDDAAEQAHVLLFTVDDKTVIDGGVNGNEAIYINHSCEPNCEAINDDGRIFIEALRTIKPGEELSFDYQLVRPGRRQPGWDKRYVCHCGAPTCRGTMLSANEN
ncbi:MAG TPA: SET domain-containing protein-lysine N-methyltransferase [Anaerolineae bacterium]